jgi:hypothetical protein
MMMAWLAAEAAKFAKARPASRWTSTNGDRKTEMMGFTPPSSAIWGGKQGGNRENRGERVENIREHSRTFENIREHSRTFENIREHSKTIEHNRKQSKTTKTIQHNRKQPREHQHRLERRQVPAPLTFTRFSFISAKFAKAPQAWRLTSMSSDCACRTNGCTAPHLAISYLFSSLRLKLQIAAKTSRKISTSVLRVSNVKGSNPPSWTIFNLFSSFTANPRRAAAAVADQSQKKSKEVERSRKKSRKSRKSRKSNEVKEVIRSQRSTERKQSKPRENQKKTKRTPKGVLVPLCV